MHKNSQDLAYTMILAILTNKTVFCLFFFSSSLAWPQEEMQFLFAGGLIMECATHSTPLQGSSIPPFKNV